AISEGIRGGGRAAAGREGLCRLLRPADGAAQAQGRRTLRLHRSGEEEPVLPGAHPELAQVRPRRAEAPSRAARGARDPREARPGAPMRGIAVLPSRRTAAIGSRKSGCALESELPQIASCDAAVCGGETLA